MVKWLHISSLKTDAAVVGNHPLDCEALLDPIAGLGTHCLTQSRLGCEFDESACESGGIAWRNEPARVTAQDLFRGSSGIGCYDGQARRHCFKRGVRAT